LCLRERRGDRNAGASNENLLHDHTLSVGCHSKLLLIGVLSEAKDPLLQRRDKAADPSALRSSG
jgi:hypothetical protein